MWLHVLHAEHTHAVEPLHRTQRVCEDGQPRELAAERSQTLQLALQLVGATVTARLGAAVRRVLFERDAQRPRQHDTRCLHYELLAISQTEVLQDPLVHDHGAISQLRLQTRPARHPPTQQDSAIDSNA